MRSETRVSLGPQAAKRRKRVVGGVRESRERDESTSPKIQTKKIHGWAELYDADVIDIAVDRDVSGKTVSPWDRPELGKWLAQPHKFDILVVSRLDRICRNAEDFFALIRWSEAQSIALVFIDEGFDLTTPAGVVAAKILAVVAEWEWTLTRSKTLDGQRQAIQEGRWRGSIAPYGYRPIKEVRNGIYGTYLEIDPETSAVIRDIVSRVVVKKEALGRIAESLNEAGIPSPADAHRLRTMKPLKGTKWATANLIQLLRSRTLLGEYQTVGNGTLRSEQTGLVIAKAEPLMTRAEWLELQERLDQVSRKKLQNRSGVSELHDVAWCDVCGLKLHHFQSGPRRYYRCSSYENKEGRCANSMVNAEVLEEEIWKILLGLFGDRPRMRRQLVPGEDHSEELAIIEEEILNLAGNLARVKPGSLAAQITLEQLEDREARKEVLEEMPSRPSEVRFVASDETLRSVYESWTVDERGQFLREHSVTIRVTVVERKTKEPKLRLFLGSLRQAYDLAIGLSDEIRDPEALALALGGQSLQQEPRSEAVPVLVRIGKLSAPPK
ncbi:recombinase family protein [Nonomuraea sp. NPDC050556]|uniref:recombinase family protein n=1 Tax=Nonomuraea sp. NPDC050556 TaxID=3364369 RepID=UPI0037B061F2